MSKQVKALIVDDSVFMRNLVRNILTSIKNFNFSVDVAENGKIALEKVIKINPDLIMLDIEMPEMNGLTFLKHARLKTRAKIIILSSVGSKNATQARALGADAILDKPSGAVSFDLEEKSGTEIKNCVAKLIG